MAYQRNIQALPDNCRFMRKDSEEEFTLVVMEPSTNDIGLALEAPDYRNPRNVNDARAIAIMCQYGKFAIPMAVDPLQTPVQIRGRCEGQLLCG